MTHLLFIGTLSWILTSCPSPSGTENLDFSKKLRIFLFLSLISFAFSHSVAHSLIRSPTHSLTHSLTHSTVSLSLGFFSCIHSRTVLTGLSSRSLVACRQNVIELKIELLVVVRIPLCRVWRMTSYPTRFETWKTSFMLSLRTRRTIFTRMKCNMP